MAAETSDLETAGNAALEMGRWTDAKEAFDAALRDAETANAAFGLAAALWWLGESQASVDASTRAYALFRRADDLEGAVRCATWLGITYKSNFGNFAAANGWIGRAERLLGTLEIGPLHAWAWVARAYRMPDLDAAAALTERALGVARDVETSTSNSSRCRSSDASRSPWATPRRGFAMIDEAMAAALGGERSTSTRSSTRAATCSTPARWRPIWSEPPSGARSPTASSSSTAARSSTPSAARCTAVSSSPAGAGRTPTGSWWPRSTSRPERAPRCTARP